MRILFCGVMVPDEIEYQVQNISAAGNRFQNNMIRNLREMGHQVDTLSYVSVELPEACKQRLLGESQESSSKNGKSHYVIPQGKNPLHILRGVRACKKRGLELLPGYDLVIAYNLFYAFLWIPKTAKKMEKRNILILADYSGPECFRGIKRKAYAYLQKQVMRNYGEVVGLSAHIKNSLKEAQRFVLMEGGVDEAFFHRFDDYEKEAKKQDQIIMYAGLLSKVTGVDILLDAISQVDRSDFQLWISGKGDLEEAVVEASNKDGRIRYLGHLPYDAYIEALQKADVLINPRNMELSENRNNFPSKIMEYLATGKYIISSQFVGWEKFKSVIGFYAMNRELRDAIAKGLEEREVDCENSVVQRETARTYLWKNQLGRIINREK